MKKNVNQLKVLIELRHSDNPITSFGTNYFVF